MESKNNWMSTIEMEFMVLPLQSPKRAENTSLNYWFTVKIKLLKVKINALGILYNLLSIFQGLVKYI